MTVNIPYDYNTDTCAHRLPCGLCRITMTSCPKFSYTINNAGTSVTYSYRIDRDKYNTYSTGDTDASKKEDV